MADLAPRLGAGYVRRAVHIAGIVARFGFADVLHSLGLDRFLHAPRAGQVDAATRGLERPVRLRLALEEIGPTGVKIGQALSARPDLLPHEYIVELRKLQEEVPPFAFSAARALLEQELGCALEERFAEFDPVPVAAASLSQVHRARLHDGTQVAVKVQRPEVRAQIEQDLAILTFVAREAERRSEWCRNNDIVSWAGEFAHILRAELDFAREGHNTDRLREQMAEYDSIVVPRVFWELTSRRVLVTEYVEGCSPNDEAGLTALGVDRARLARRFAEVMFKQVTEQGFFHADPHAGNLKVLPDGRIALLDAGHVDFAGQEVRDHMLSLFEALLEGDSRGVVNVLTLVGVISPRTDLPSLRLDVDKTVARFVPSRQVPFGLAEVMDAIFGLLIKHSIRLPATFASLLRAVVIAQGVCLQLDPDFDPWAATGDAVRAMLSNRLRPHHLLAGLHSSLREWTFYLRALPRQLSDLMLRAQAGGPRMRLELEHVDRHLHRLDIMVNRLSFAIVVAAFIIASATILSSERALAALGNPLALGFVAAGVFMGLWLLYSIVRSGRL